MTEQSSEEFFSADYTAGASAKAIKHVGGYDDRSPQDRHSPITVEGCVPEVSRHTEGSNDEDVTEQFFKEGYAAAASTEDREHVSEYEDRSQQDRHSPIAVEGYVPLSLETIWRI